jgi:hypothetical protein
VSKISQDLLQLGAQVSGYINGPLATVLVIGAAIGTLFGLFKWITAQARTPGSYLSRFAIAWRDRLIPIMLISMGVAGAILIIAAVFGAIA